MNWIMHFWKFSLWVWKNIAFFYTFISTFFSSLKAFFLLWWVLIKENINELVFLIEFFISEVKIHLFTNKFQRVISISSHKIYFFIFLQGNIYFIYFQWTSAKNIIISTSNWYIITTSLRFVHAYLTFQLFLNIFYPTKLYSSKYTQNNETMLIKYENNFKQFYSTINKIIKLFHIFELTTSHINIFTI